MGRGTSPLSWFEPGSLPAPLGEPGSRFPVFRIQVSPHSLFEKAHFICDFAVRSRAVAHVTGIIFPVFPLVPASFRLIPHLPVLENFFFFFSAEDRITHRNGKDHCCLSSVAHPPSVPNHPVLFSFLLPRLCGRSLVIPGGFLLLLLGLHLPRALLNLKHFKNNAFIYFWLCWVSVARELFSSCGVRASPLPWRLFLRSVDLRREGFSSAVARGLRAQVQ